MSLPETVTLTVGNKDYTSEPDLGLIHSTESLGGYKQATFKVCKSTIDFDLGDQVTVYDTQYRKYPFIGLVFDVHKNGNNYEITAKRATTLQVHRFSTVPQDLTHPSGVIAGKVYRSGTPMVEALRDGLQLCEDVFDGGIVDPGNQFVTDSDNLAGNTAEQVWNYICSLLAALGLQWHVRGANGLQVVTIDFRDEAARYFTELDETQIDEQFSLDAIINRSTLEWGNDQVWVEPIGAIDKSQIKKLHDHYINGANKLTTLTEAQGLAGAYLSRFGRFRSVNDTLNMKCDKDVVRVVPPLVTLPVDTWPLWLVEAGHGIHLNNRLANKFFPPLKFITGTNYTWDTGELQVSCGEQTNLNSNIESQQSYQVNRLMFGPASGAAPRWGNHPLADADHIPIFGPEMPGDVPPSNVAGIPMMVGSDGGQQSTQTPYDRVVHPGLIADEGLEINYSFDISTDGWKGGTFSIPGTLGLVRMSLWKSDATNGLQKDSCSFNVYTKKVGENPVFLVSCAFTNVSEGEIEIKPTKTLPDRQTQIVFKVIVPADQAETINVSLKAPKHFPGLKI